MSPAEKVKRYRDDGYWIEKIMTYAKDPAEGCRLAAEIMETRCPEGMHPLDGEVAKGGHGRRASVQVWFRENLRRSTE